MLAKPHRLKKNKQFQYVYRKGKPAVAPCVVAIFLPLKEGVLAGFSVSRKVGNAVRRNRVKRQLRALFAERLCEMRPGRYIIVARESAKDAEYAALRASFQQALTRGKLLRK